MESIKNKMEELVAEKATSVEIFETLTAGQEAAETRCSKTETGIAKSTREISKFEEQLDDVTTSTATAMEHLEKATTIADDAELEVSALVRRLQLLEEETQRVNEKLDEVVSKLTVVEAAGEENERARKILEANNFKNEETQEMIESQLAEAIIIAEEADRKYEESGRKLRMVESDAERITDKADEFESKISEYQFKLDDKSKQLKEIEEIACRNGEQEDKYEDKIHELKETLKNLETRAEFGERTVEKLESTIDTVQENLLAEKRAFIEMSRNLDETLKEMMTLGDC